MAVYKVITLIGTSFKSWEEAAAAAVKTAKKTVRGLRVAEIEELDINPLMGFPNGARVADALIIKK